MKDLKYVSVMLEDLRDQMRALAEAIVAIQQNMVQKDAYETDIERIESKLDATIFAVKDHSRELRSHDSRIAVLERGAKTNPSKA